MGVILGFTQTILRNQDVTVKLKSELIFIKRGSLLGNEEPDFKGGFANF